MWYRYTSTFDFPQYVFNHYERCWNYRKGKDNETNFLNCTCPYAQTIKDKLRQIARDYLIEELKGKTMTPEEIQRIESMPEISEFEAKLIFIRNLGRSDYKIHRFDISKILAKLPQEPLINSSREEILRHLDNLEKCQKLIKSYVQGHQDEYAREVEPEIREKQAKEKSEKDAKKSGGPKTLEGFGAKHGLSKNDLEQLLAFMNENKK